MTNKEFTLKYGNEARAAAAGSGIFVETVLGQAILESASGESKLSKAPYFNFFGVKADNSWKGAKVLMNTREVVDGKSIYVNRYFRDYGSPRESFINYIKFLKENPRYTKAGVFTAKTYQEQIKAIANAGYATGTNYAASVTNIAQNVSKYLNSLLNDLSKGNKNELLTILLILSIIILISYTI